MTDLVYSAEKDRARSDEYLRFRKLTAELSKRLIGCSIRKRGICKSRFLC